jgi:hypothetical protein
VRYVEKNCLLASHNGKRDDIVNVRRPEESYLILESEGLESERLIYVCGSAADSVLTIVMFNIT